MCNLFGRRWSVWSASPRGILLSQDQLCLPGDPAGIPSLQFPEFRASWLGKWVISVGRRWKHECSIENADPEERRKVIIFLLTMETFSLLYLLNTHLLSR